MTVCHLFSDGSLFLAASSLTHRYWVGSLYFYREAHQAVDEMSCNVMIQVDTGMSDIAHIENSNNFITATDSGNVNHKYFFHYNPFEMDV